MAKPVTESWLLIKRACRYLQNRRSAGLLFRWQELPTRGGTLVLQTDSDWATCPHTRKSRSGGVIWHGCHCVAFWCKTQDRVARSSGEAELKSSCCGIAELLGMRNISTFLTGQKCSLIHQLDASAAKSMLLRQGCGGLKHLDIRTLWVQEAILAEDIDVQKINRTQNTADALCSPNSEKELQTRMQTLGVVYV